MNFSRIALLVTICMLSGSLQAHAESFELVNFDTEDGGRIEASLFRSGNDKVVIFAHGAIFDKESWYFLAEAFQRQGVSALSIDFRGYGNSVAGSSAKKKYDILAAITYVKEQGYSDINVLGASMGGAAVLAALSESPVAVQKAVLLAPAGGPAISSETTGKLFVVSEKEGLFDRVMATYSASAEPKQIRVFPGNAHAQHLFKTDDRDELIEQILNFIAPLQPE